MRPRSRAWLGGAFTLVEVVVALTVLATASLFLTRAFLLILQVTSAAGSTTVASALAVGRLEQLRGGPESQQTVAGRRAAFDAIVDEGPVAFPAPYGRYASQVLVNRVSLAPSAPSWLTEGPMHADTMKWVTVRVTVDGRTVGQVSSAVIRDMVRRP